MADEKIMELADLFKYFGDSTRLKILFVLFDNEDISVGDIADKLSMTISAISHQLKILKAGKLVKSKRQGKSILYSLDDDHVRMIIKMGIDHINE